MHCRILRAVFKKMSDKRCAAKYMNVKKNHTHKKQNSLEQNTLPSSHLPPHKPTSLALRDDEMKYRQCSNSMRKT